MLLTWISFIYLSHPFLLFSRSNPHPVQCITCVVLPQTLYADDVRLEVCLCRLYIDVIAYMIHSVAKTAVLTIGALETPLPIPGR